MKPYINDRKCYVDPRICTAMKSCAKGAISYIVDDDEPLGGRIVFDYNKCLGCGTCAKECCGGAINMKLKSIRLLFLRRINKLLTIKQCYFYYGWDIIYVYSHKQIYEDGGDQMKKLLNTLKALSDETRLRILNLLFEKELCVCDIMETLKITQTKASRHLAYLKNAGLVADRKHAQWVYYSVIHDEANKFLDSLVSDNLRKLEQYKNDLEALKQWLSRKNISCE